MCLGTLIVFLRDLQMKKWLGDTLQKPKKRRQWFNSFWSWQGRRILFPGQTRGHWLWETSGFNSLLRKMNSKGRCKGKRLDKLHCISPWLALSLWHLWRQNTLAGLYPEDRSGEDMKQEGKNNWFLDCADNHSGFCRTRGISFAFPYSPECKQERDRAQGTSRPVHWTEEGLRFDICTQQASGV